MNQTYTSVAWFQAKEGRTKEFLDAFHAAGMVTRSTALDGCRDITVFESVDGTNQFFVVGHWDSMEAYALWQEKAVAEAPPGSIEKMIAEVDRNRLGVLMTEVVR